MSPIKTLTLYAHPAAPHPWKIILILTELELPFDVAHKTTAAVTKEQIRQMNPNERVPILQDPNTGLTLWEAGAIAEYIIEMYDQEGRLSYNTLAERWATRIWVVFNVTTQDQYYGQKAYFTLFHENKDIPSVLKHYTDEVKRVLGVLELHLRRTGQPYLVGDRVTYADLMFAPFHNVLCSVILYPEFEAEWKADFPRCYEWHQRLMRRPKVVEAFQQRAEAERIMKEENGRVIR
ncbi:glutathione s-transferase [Apiospora sp. TS-2023a]